MNCGQRVAVLLRARDAACEHLYAVPPQARAREWHGPGRVVCFSARAQIPYTTFSYEEGDCLLFGGETNGLPATLLQRHPDRSVCIPIPSGKVRSLNLATAVGIALYEALRQRHRW